MFVQHMVASLKSDGKLAWSCHTVSSSGVAKKRPAATGSSRTASSKRSSVCRATCSSAPASGLRAGHQQARCQQPQAGSLHERRPGIQGRQEPELTTARRHREDHPGLSHPPAGRQVLPLGTVDELEREEFNLNIRRYVDNSPPPNRMTCGLISTVASRSPRSTSLPATSPITKA